MPLPYGPSRDDRSTGPYCAVCFIGQAHVAHGVLAPVSACLRHHIEDPYAAYLDLHVDSPDPITWVFARCLLAEGLRTHAGLGDVTVHPAPANAFAAVVVNLRPEGEGPVCRISLPTGAVREFLERSGQISAPGSEHLNLDIDALIHRLLTEPPPSP
ncbi:SsgA family sporulation/cell division regulator [Kitasatospora sp. NPDC059648]|uniref:SsgA family sporulation/cell division regulator n=1 Tax=Kitasatospora sp. NPDC059648 TaxID=3346894 RepID=UPI0036C28A8B